MNTKFGYYVCMYVCMYVINLDKCNTKTDEDRGKKIQKEESLYKIPTT